MGIISGICRWIGPKWEIEVEFAEKFKIWHERWYTIIVGFWSHCKGLVAVCSLEIMAAWVQACKWNCQMIW